MPEGKRTVVALRDFHDKAEGVDRKAGDEFAATPERIAQLNARGPEQGGEPLVKDKNGSRPARKAPEVR